MYNKANWNHYRQLLEVHEHPTNIETIEDVDEEIEKLHNKILRADNLFIPQEQYKTKPFYPNTNEVNNIKKEEII